MKLFIWRHNRKYHSYSMLEEPCVHQGFYNDAIVMVTASSEEAALALLKQEQGGWLPEEVRRLKPRVINLDKPQVIWQEVRGD